MSNEYEFLTRRLQIADELLQQVHEYDRDGNGSFRLRHQPSAKQEDSLVRECRVLEKLLAEVPEGKVHKALADWRKNLGKKFIAYRNYYAPMREEHERWLRIPFPFRVDTPEPPQPPDLHVTDQHGHEWLVDETLLRVLDDLSERLEKWNQSEE